MLNTTALLQDQFDLGASPVLTEKVADLRLTWFCNPVQKTLNGTVTKILMPASHLAFYRITPQQMTPRRVVISNQFGDQLLALGSAEVLAVPSGKALLTATGAPPARPPIPQDLDHYKCYIASGEKIGAVVILTDQFHTEQAQVLEPVLFCNPVQKTHPIGTAPTSIQRPADHLACYTITPTTFQTTIYYNNQFVSPTGTTPSVKVGPSEMLCTPSYKLRWSVVNPPASATPSDSR